VPQAAAASPGPEAEPHALVIQLHLIVSNRALPVQQLLAGLKICGLAWG
jgi:hypothetical protein